MKQPIWLFSMDSEHFSAAPMTTGGLKAYYHKYGQRPLDVDIQLVHFLEREQLKAWLTQWQDTLLPIAREAVAQGLQPVAGFSFYTWNAAEFLDLVRVLKQSCPELLTIAGGPHVQQATDYLGIDPIDVIVLGEGEATLTQWLDAPTRADWHNLA
jgi:B12 binding domain